MCTQPAFTLLRSLLQPVAGYCCRNATGSGKKKGSAAVSEGSLLERVTAAAEERQLSLNTLAAFRRSWLEVIARAATEGASPSKLCQREDGVARLRTEARSRAISRVRNGDSGQENLVLNQRAVVRSNSTVGLSRGARITSAQQPEVSGLTDERLQSTPRRLESDKGLGD